MNIRHQQLIITFFPFALRIEALNNIIKRLASRFLIYYCVLLMIILCLHYVTFLRMLIYTIRM